LADPYSCIVFLPPKFSQTNAVPLSILRDPETLADRTKAG